MIVPEHNKVYLGDCLEVMKQWPDCCVGAIVTDPPYGLQFMGAKWDHGVPGMPFWEECLRVLKPGGFLLAMGGTRTYHRLVCAIEDAGFRIHPMLVYAFGVGFPKATNLSKQFDKQAGVEREVGPVDPARAGRLVNQGANT